MSHLPKIVVFSDVNANVQITGPYELSYNEVAIQEALETCFATPVRSRMWRRRFGSRLLHLLFQPMNDDTARSISLVLKDVAEKWEDRIANITCKVLPDYENQQYYVEFTYTIPKLGDKMVNYTFNLLPQKA